MTPIEAAAALVELYGKTRNYISADKRYEQAIAMACVALGASDKKEAVLRGN